MFSKLKKFYNNYLSLIMLFICLFYLSGCSYNKKHFAIYGTDSTIIIADKNSISKLRCIVKNNRTFIRIQYYPTIRTIWCGFLRISVEDDPEIEYIEINSIEKCIAIINDFNINTN